jgi:hypothetical protein
MSTLIPKYDQGATGAVNRPFNLKLAESISVKDFGAVGNGIVDDTTAIQNAINASAALAGGSVYFPAGTYNYTTLTINNAISIYGEVASTTVINCTSNTGGITVATHYGVSFSDISLYGTASHTGILVNIVSNAVGYNTHSKFENCNFYQFANGISFTNAGQFSVSNCYFTSYTASAVFVQNTTTPDAGDSTIYGCIFSALDETQGYGVYQTSSGGLRIINNKFLSGLSHYYLYLSAGVSTSILLIEGNSFEFAGDANLKFLTPGGAGTEFWQTNIVGNQFSVSSGKKGIDFAASTTGITNFINISENILRGAGAWTGMQFKNVQGLTIGPNIITTFGATGGTGINFNTGTSGNVASVRYRSQYYGNLSATYTNSIAVSDFVNIDQATIYGAGLGTDVTITASATPVFSVTSFQQATLLIITDTTDNGVAVGILTPTTFTTLSNTISSVTFTVTANVLTGLTTGGSSSRVLFIAGLTPGYTTANR